MYRKCKDKGYIRTYYSMCRQIRKLELEKPKAKPPKKKKREKKEEKMGFKIHVKILIFR